MEKVSILIPTRQRYKKLAKCLARLFENTVYTNFDVIVITDKDDPKSVEVVKKLPFVEDEGVKILVKEKREMYVGKINEGFHKTDSPLIVFLADDIEVNRNWLTEAVSTFHESFPDGMGLVSFQDEFDDRLAPHGLISRKYVEEFLNGNIFYPGYIHYWCDTELTLRSKKWGRFAYSSKAKIFHNRPNKIEERDKICQEGSMTSDKDRRILTWRNWFNFPNIMPKKKSLELPDRISLHFTPSDELNFYFGFGIDTRKKLDWKVGKEKAEFLLSNFPLNWGSPQAKIWELSEFSEVFITDDNRLGLKPVHQHDICFQVWNRPEFTKRSLGSLDKNTDWDLINKFYIMDDNSEKETRKILEDYENPKKVIVRENFGGSRTSFLKFLTLAKTELVFNFENDVLAPPNWNRILAETFVKNPNVAIIRGWSQDLLPGVFYTTCHAGFSLEFIRSKASELQTLTGGKSAKDRWMSDNWRKFFSPKNKLMSADVFFDKIEAHQESLPLVHKYFLKGWEKKDIDYQRRLNIIEQTRRRTGYHFPFDYKEDADEVLFEFDNIVKDEGLEYFLIYGTCLGFYRDSDYVLGDNDIDVSVKCGVETRKKLFEKLERAEFMRYYTIGANPSRNAHFFKKDILIDIFFFLQEVHYSFLNLARKISYKGREFNVPAETEKYLEFLYGNWKVPEEGRKSKF